MTAQATHGGRCWPSPIWPGVSGRTALAALPWLFLVTPRKTAGTGAELLADVRRVFDERGVDRIAGADLLAALVADEERPWATFNHARRCRSRNLPAGCRPSALLRAACAYRTAGLRRLPNRGFHRRLRALSARYPLSKCNTATSKQRAGCGAFSNRHTEKPLHFDKAPQASNGAGCGDVALSNPQQATTRRCRYDAGRTAERGCGCGPSP